MLQLFAGDADLCLLPKFFSGSVGWPWSRQEFLDWLLQQRRGQVTVNNIAEREDVTEVQPSVAVVHPKMAGARDRCVGRTCHMMELRCR